MPDLDDLDDLDDAQTPPGDPRYTYALILDVADVLERHRYARLNGHQLVELESHLFCLLGSSGDRCDGRAGELGAPTLEDAVAARVGIDALRGGG